MRGKDPWSEIQSNRKYAMSSGTLWQPPGLIHRLQPCSVFQQSIKTWLTLTIWIYQHVQESFHVSYRDITLERYKIFKTLVLKRFSRKQRQDE